MSDKEVGKLIICKTIELAKKLNIPPDNIKIEFSEEGKEILKNEPGFLQEMIDAAFDGFNEIKEEENGQNQ